MNIRRILYGMLLFALISIVYAIYHSIDTNWYVGIPFILIIIFALYKIRK